VRWRYTLSPGFSRTPRRCSSGSRACSGAPRWGGEEGSDCLLPVHSSEHRDTHVCTLVLNGKSEEAQWENSILVIYTRAGSIEIQPTDTDETPAQPS
jgi:hypothetical protein